MIKKPPKISFEASTLKNYKILFLEGFYKDGVEKRAGSVFRKALLNTFIVSFITVTINIIFSTIVGYSFAKIEFKSKKLLFLIIIITMPIPVILISIPLIQIMSFLELIDTYFGLSLLYVTFIMPLTIWISTSYFQSIPQCLEDAAHIDGCDKLQVFLKIALPLAKPMIGSIAIITFLSAWGQFFLPLIFSHSDSKQLTVAITEFVGKYELKKGLMAAAGTISIFPPLLIVLFFNKLIIYGLLKGVDRQ